VSAKDLFRIETDRLRLTWGAARRKEPYAVETTGNVPGTLVVLKRRSDLVFGADNWRSEVPLAVQNDCDLTVGPRLFEQTDYLVYAKSKTGEPISLEHRDPSLLRDVNASEGSNVVHGAINFGSDIGRSLFSLRVGGRPEIDFEVEVFPSKLDYKSDYQEIVADVQDILTGLAFDYLRSTFQLGTPLSVKEPSHVEWLFLLKYAVGDLERGLRYLSQHPFRSLTREAQEVRAEKVRRIDNSIRRAVVRGSGAGQMIDSGSNIRIRQHLFERRARPTLDTPEHRWLASKLVWIRRRLALLRQIETAREQSARRKATLEELQSLESRISRLETFEPIVEALGDPPPNFASVQLLTGPGYKEAYKACLILTLGLRISGDPIGLSVKELNLLYEYWCFLAIIRCVARQLGKNIPSSQLVQVERQGLRVILARGKECRVSFDSDDGRRISATYNPRLSGSGYLVPQQPDFLVSVENPGWPPVQLILDAKYRLDSSQQYQDQYGSPGPPDDAINVLHRYRDAIVDTSRGEAQPRPKRTVIQGAALFPYHEQLLGAYRRTRLWESLERIGIGAIPLLPGSEEYLSEWVKSLLARGGWALAERVIPHRVEQHAWDWRVAASEVVLVGVLRGGNEAEHLNWIQTEGSYYMRLLQRQNRQYVVKWLAIYSPTALREPGAVTRVAEVQTIEVVPRAQIPTPWQSQRSPDQLQVLYRLGGFTDLPRAVANRGLDGGTARFSTSRWTSRLALERAQDVKELLLETEPEWRFYEELSSHKIKFEITAGTPTLVSSEDPIGRAWFKIADQRIQFRGAQGFVVKNAAGETLYFAHIPQLVEYCRTRSADHL
jgi:hypothetical protein